MITPGKLTNRAIAPATLTQRQAEAVTLIERYAEVAGEPPSYGWLARRLKISRPGALDLVQRARRRGAFLRRP